MEAKPFHFADNSSKQCTHGKERRYCKECGGNGLCTHGRHRYRCKECDGKGICEHRKERYFCKECGGKGICKHGKQRHHCYKCWSAKNAEAAAAAEKEVVERWRRDSRLREKMLPTVAAEQKGRCAGLYMCLEVAGGKATNMCPWGAKRVPEWAQQLDHKTPYALTQDDSRENLQMLCACCHAGKTAAERGAKSVGVYVVPAPAATNEDAGESDNGKTADLLLDYDDDDPMSNDGIELPPELS